MSSDAGWNGIMCAGHLKDLSREVFCNLTIHVFFLFVLLVAKREGEENNITESPGKCLLKDRIGKGLAM